MNEYLNAFQNMTQSADGLMTDELSSLEIQQSATSLKASVQPCIEELKQSASRLKQLVLVCSDELHHAEDVWVSKPRIVEAAKQEIWEQLGEISGCSFKIHLLNNQLKSQAIEQARQFWDKQVLNIRKRWFLDNRNGKSKDVVAWEKEQFIKDLRLQLEFQSNEMNLIVKEILKNFYKELEQISRETIEKYIDLLDESSKSIFNTKANQIVSEVKAKLINSTGSVVFKNQELANAVNNALNNLISQGFLIPGLKGTIKQGILSINWQHFVQFNAQAVSAIENIITKIFDDRVKVTTQALEQAISFYNDFLERQERYQQETPEQREAEKAWIDRQRYELTRVQEGIEAILNAD